MSDKWINDIGTIRLSKEDKLYIKVDKAITLEPGDVLTLRSKKDEIAQSLKAGKISEDRAEELLEKTSFIKYTIHKAPKKK